IYKRTIFFKMMFFNSEHTRHSLLVTAMMLTSAIKSKKIIRQKSMLFGQSLINSGLDILTLFLYHHLLHEYSRVSSETTF
ncbi:MAG: hypothetical protein ACH346_07340, partial [Chthoniobacterales bacterium]